MHCRESFRTRLLPLMRGFNCPSLHFPDIVSICLPQKRTTPGAYGQRPGSLLGFSRVASRFKVLAGPTVRVRCHDLKPDFSINIVWSPGPSFTVDGVLPANLPSIVMSAPSGVDLIVTVEASLG
jgi:hypothetical protein